jgi:predicted MFS family arabinose efflux permease
MIIGASTLLVVHLVFALTPLKPHLFLILLGVSFSLVPAAMWPSMVKLVRDKEIGTAYGLMYSVQNLGLWGVPILAGIVLDTTNPGTPDVLNYTPTILLFAGLSFVGLIFALFLKWEDSRKHFGVELPLNKK